MADLPEIVASGGSAAKTTLSDKYCGPLEAKHTRALFSFPLNSCGSRVQVGKLNQSCHSAIGE